MPRLPVDGKKVIEYRVTLGAYERERLDSLITSLQVKNIGTPIVDILQDVSATAAVLVILSEVFAIDFQIPEIVDDAGDLVKAFVEAGRQSVVAEQVTAGPERADSLVGGIKNLIFGLIRPLITRPEDMIDIDLGGPIYTPPSDLPAEETVGSGPGMQGGL